jgi:hypothetical protein
MLHILALAAAVAAADPPAAPAASPAQAEQPAKAAKPKLVCRTEQVTGSLLGGHRVCHTQQEWDVLAREGRKDLDDTTRRGLQFVPPGS